MELGILITKDTTKLFDSNYGPINKIIKSDIDRWSQLPLEMHNTFTFMHLADAFIQSDLQLHSGYTFFVSICVPWESNPQPFALLTQCSTTESHRNTIQ